MGGRLGGGRADSLGEEAGSVLMPPCTLSCCPCHPHSFALGCAPLTWKKLRGWPEDWSHRPLSTAKRRSPGDTSTPSLCSST